MIYLVSKQQELFESDLYSKISIEESLIMLESCKILQYDSETSGLDCHLTTLLCIQFGNKEKDFQIIIDCGTIDILLYKHILETKFLIGHNIKFDLKYLYNYNIIPTKIYDTMIAEQLRYLAYPKGMYRMSLQEVALRYLNQFIDKSIREDIIHKGLMSSVILYAAKDVVYLEDIMWLQIEYFKKIKALKALEIECNFTLCCAYYEWCGVKLDENKWAIKIQKDKDNLLKYEEDLNKFVISLENPSFYTINRQGNLFTGFDVTPKCNINWKSSKQVLPLLKFMGFDCTGIDKKTKEQKDSIEEKVLKSQKGINDTFLEIYFNWAEVNKLCSTYGQQYINAINPKTKRIHTEFRALGTDTGRLACGSQKINIDLAKLKKLPLIKQKDTSKVCAYPQVQNLPNDAITRSCFIPEKGNSMIAIDYSGEESRLLASLANDKAMLEVFTKGEDMHSKVAYLIYPDLIPRDTPIELISKKYKHLRQEAKGPEFCFAFLGNWATLVANYGMSEEKAKSIEKNYKDGFYGATRFQEECKKFISNNGYINICEETGHKAFWWDWEEWKKRQKDPSFWETYKTLKVSNSPIPSIYKEHFAAKSKWDKNSVNSRTQGLGAVIFKIFNYEVFIWIVQNNLFNKVKFCVPAHDEIVLECPKELETIITEKVSAIMSEVGERFCHRLPMPVEASVGDHWIH